MKKLLTLLLLVSVVIVTLRAEEKDIHNNRLYVSIGTSAYLSQVPIYLQLENPTIGITAVEMYISLPEGAEVSYCQLSNRAEDTHKITDGETEKGYFISVVSEEVVSFAGSGGTLCTIYCDFSNLPEGDYSMSASGGFAVGVSGNTVTGYTVANQNERFTIQDNYLSGVEITAPDNNAGELEIYNLQGVKLYEPQKGKINIINGKKVYYEK